MLRGGRGEREKGREGGREGGRRETRWKLHNLQFQDKQQSVIDIVSAQTYLLVSEHEFVLEKNVSLLGRAQTFPNLRWTGNDTNEAVRSRHWHFQ